MTQQTEVADRVTSAVPWGRRLWRIGLLLILIDVFAGSLIVGLQMRQWMWEYTKPARFRYDIGRNYLFGRQAVEQGYLNVYENQVKFRPDEAHKMNYPPLRYGTFGVWAWWNQKHFANYDQWQEDHSFNAFVMYFNTVLEFLAAVAALLIVRHWIWRTGPPIPQPTIWDRLFRGGFRYTLAFLLVWFNIGMIVSAHGWPSWDMWVVPFFLWTVLLCCWEKWFLAGVCLGVGVMFKGQQLAVLPVFVLWPIFAGQPGRALRFLSGFVLAFGLIVSGWMLSYRPEIAFDKKERILDWPAIWWVVTCGAAVLLANAWRLVSFIVAAR
ncbi:MAG TPA: hypothetical protein VHP11_04540, partial [Tepidisphaeraceae bacterium]|nr:hypothetical protein [Tepidisphaeraceae bacterium]